MSVIPREDPLRSRQEGQTSIFPILVQQTRTVRTVAVAETASIAAAGHGNEKHTVTFESQVNKGIADGYAGLDPAVVLAQAILSPPIDLGIVSGAITITDTYHLVDTEAAAASDNLDTINGGTASAFLILRPANDARTVIIKHNTGNILVVGNVDLTLDDAHDFAILIFDIALSKWLCKG